MEKKGGELKDRISLLAQEQERRRRLAKLKRDANRKAEFLRKKAIIETHDVYNIIRWFFQEFLEKRYQFTITELKKELREVYISSSTRKMLDLILEKISSIEYANVHYKHDELVELLDVFKQVVNQLVRTHTKKKGVLTWLKHLFINEEDTPDVIISELPVIESTDAMNIRMNILVEKCYVALDQHSLKKAKTSYNALLQEYGTLEDDLKQKFFPLVDQTYQDILNRSAMIKK